MKALSLKTCQLLYNVVGEEVGTDFKHTKSGIQYRPFPDEVLSPAYTIADILSKQFLEALGRKLKLDSCCEDCGSEGFTCECQISGRGAHHISEWQYHAHKLLELSWTGADEIERYVEELIQKQE